MGSQRVGHDWAIKNFHFTKVELFLSFLNWQFNFDFKSLSGCFKRLILFPLWKPESVLWGRTLNTQRKSFPRISQWILADFKYRHLLTLDFEFQTSFLSPLFLLLYKCNPQRHTSQSLITIRRILLKDQCAKFQQHC